MTYQQGDLTKNTEEYLKNPPLRKTKFYGHLANLGEIGIYLSCALLTTYLCVYFGWEIILCLFFLSALTYGLVTFEENPKASFLRMVAIVAGCSIGIKELAFYFTLPVAGSVSGLITCAVVLRQVYKAFLFLSSPVPNDEGDE